MRDFVKWSAEGGDRESDLSKEIESETRSIAAEVTQLAAHQAQTLKSRMKRLDQGVDRFPGDLARRFRSLESKLRSWAKEPRFWFTVLLIWAAVTAVLIILAASGILVVRQGEFIFFLFAPFALAIGLLFNLVFFGFILWTIFALTFGVALEALRHNVVETSGCEKCRVHAVYLVGQCASCLVAQLGERATQLAGFKEATASAAQLAGELGLYAQKAALEREIFAREEAAAEVIRLLAREAVRRVFQKYWGGPVSWASEGVSIESYCSSPLSEAVLANVKRLREAFGFALSEIVVVDGGNIGVQVSWENPAWPGIAVSGILAV